MKYLPPNEVPQSRKKRSLGPTNNSQVLETPSPILHKRSRAQLEDNVGNSSTASVKRAKENSCVDDKVQQT